MPGEISRNSWFNWLTDKVKSLQVGQTKPETLHIYTQQSSTITVHKNRPRSIKSWVPLDHFVHPRKTLLLRRTSPLFFPRADFPLQPDIQSEIRLSSVRLLHITSSASAKLDCEVSIVRPGPGKSSSGHIDDVGMTGNVIRSRGDGKNLFSRSLKVKSNNKSGLLWWRAGISQTARPRGQKRIVRYSIGGSISTGRLIFLLTPNVV